MMVGLDVAKAELVVAVRPSGEQWTVGGWFLKRLQLSSWVKLSSAFQKIPSWILLRQ
jgi:hypothetical protein